MTKGRPLSEVLSDLRTDARIAIRGIRRKPGFSIAVTLTFALGIAATTTVYSFLNAFVFRDIAFRRPDQLVHIWGTNPGQGFTTERVSLPVVDLWKERSRSVTDFALFNYTTEALSSALGSEPQQVSVGRVSANALTVLGVAPAMGRVFVAGEDQPGAAKVAVISWGFWQSRFAGASDVLGRTLRLDEQEYQVIGVMPESFRFPLPLTQVLAPFTLDRTRYTRTVRSFQVFGRVRDGVDLATANREMDVVAREVNAPFPEDRTRSARVVALRSALNFADEILLPMSIVMAAAVGLVLLVACANVASLLLAKAAGREVELAVRSALGAGRQRIIRLLLTESLVLSLGGGATGLALASVATRAIDRAIPMELYRVGAIELDPAAVAFALAVTVVSAILAGLLPAWRASRGDVQVALRHGATSRGAHKGAVARGMLVVPQLGFTLALMIAGALMLRSVLRMRTLDIGVDRASVTAGVVLPRGRFDTREKIVAVQERILESAKAQTGVTAAAFVDMIPLNHETDYQAFVIDGQDAATPDKRPNAGSLHATSGYFAAMGMRMLEGSDLPERLTSSDELPVVVNKTFADKFLGRGERVGRALQLSDDNGQLRAARIVGVVSDSRHERVDGVREPLIFQPLAATASRGARLVIRGPLASPRAAVRAVDPDILVTEVRTMGQGVEEFALPQRALSMALMVLAAGGLMLAIVATFGVLSHLVVRREREIGVRVALGASSRMILRLVVRDAGLVVVPGLVLGVAGGAGLGALLGAVLGGISMFDAPSFGIPALAVAGAAAAACLVPARRAAHVSPMTAMRSD